MLTSITPLGERGRGHRWGTTAGWLVAGHMLGGALLGSGLALVGWLVHATGVDFDGATTTAVIAAVAALGVALDLAGVRVPGRRQVDERWLTSYRGWVYGFGFGVQLGFGLVTVVNTALLGAVLVAGVLVSPAAALAIGVVYGLTRGLAATANGWVRSVGDLRRLHRLLDTFERRAGRLGAGIVAVAAVGAVIA